MRAAFAGAAVVATAGEKRHCSACTGVAAGPPAERGPADAAGARRKWGRCADRTGKGTRGAYMMCRR